MEDVLTPECDRLHAVVDKSQVIGKFLEWFCLEHQVVLPKSINNLLAEFFDIDEEKVEQEKRTILEQLRRAE